MKAVVCTRYGPPEVLRLEDVDKPSPRPDEVCIRVIATAVTSSDCYHLPFAYRVMARFALGFRAPRRRILGMVLAVRSSLPGELLPYSRLATRSSEWTVMSPAPMPSSCAGPLMACWQRGRRACAGGLPAG
jgi:hypothetical protein